MSCAVATLRRSRPPRARRRRRRSPGCGEEQASRTELVTCQHPVLERASYSSSASSARRWPKDLPECVRRPRPVSPPARRRPAHQPAGRWSRGSRSPRRAGTRVGRHAGVRVGGPVHASARSPPVAARGKPAVPTAVARTPVSACHRCHRTHAPTVRGREPEETPSDLGEPLELPARRGPQRPAAMLDPGVRREGGRCGYRSPRRRNRASRDQGREPKRTGEAARVSRKRSPSTASVHCLAGDRTCRRPPGEGAEAYEGRAPPPPPPAGLDRGWRQQYRRPVEIT